MNIKSFLTILSITTSLSVVGQEYPFPMTEHNYKFPYGIAASEPDNEMIQEKFEAWDNAMYRESEDGQYGRIRFDDENYTVSEGIGYGMLIYVYMANSTNDLCQERFDRLYAYYKRWSNGNGVMNWKIEDFNKVNSYNGATDADLDVAFALCLAAKQWGHSTEYVYAEEAEILLNNIYKKEISSHTINGESLMLVNPGDSWTSIANPCYFTLASIGVFKQAQEYLNFSQTNDWESVYNDSHIYMELSQRNGLWPNWSNWDGSPCDRSPYDPTSMDYGWDACRTPWRVAWDYVWYGSESSKRMMDKTIEMMDANNILNNTRNAGYYSNLNGDSYTDLEYGGNGNSSAFVGGYACALTTDAAQQANLDIYHNVLKKSVESPYYSPTLQVLYLLMTSGNAANFYDLEGGAEQIVVRPTAFSISTDGKQVTVSCTKNMDETLDDFSGFTLYIDGVKQENAIQAMTVDGIEINLTLQNVEILPQTLIALSYNGETIVSADGGVLNKVIKNPVTNNVFEVGGNTIFADCEQGSNTLLGGGWYSYSDGAAGSSQAYSIVNDGANGTDSAATFVYENIASYAGMGFNILNGENPLNCTGSTGISFYHKGNACKIEAKTITKKNANYSYQTYNINSHEEWTLVTLPWETIASDFVTSGYVTEVTGFQWSRINATGTFSIDEVTLIGREFSPSGINRTELVSAIMTANSLLTKATTEKYSQESIDAFITAIDTLADVNVDPTATSEDIALAAQTMQTAIETFQKNAFASKSTLLKLIQTATDKSTYAVVGEETGNYTQESKDALDNAIAVATEISLADKITRGTLENALTDLKNAIATFEESELLVVDKSKLLEYIKLATEILDTTEVGTEPGQYPELRRSNLEKILETSTNVYNNSKASQTTIDSKAENLQSQYILYVASKIKTAISDVEYALNIYPNPCSNTVFVEANKEIAFVTFIGMNGKASKFSINGTTTSISISQMPIGVYTVYIAFADGSTKTSSILKK